MTDAADWVSCESALQAVLDAVSPLPPRAVSLHEALGRALAEPVRSPVDHPAWDNSAMDGFAVHAGDVRGASRERPVTLPVAARIPAGRFPEAPLAPGTAVQVTTGAPVPEGASGVIRVEHTDGGAGSSVTVYDDADAERHIRRAGEDLRRGDVLLEPGEEVTPAAIALLAVAGAARPTVRRRPRVGVLANGDELADLDDYDLVRAGRKIMNSNGHALTAQLRTAGAEPVPLGIARDDPADLRRRLERGADCDALITAAGVSVGEHDHVKDVLSDMGLERRFWRVRMRPGSATLFGLLGGRPFWGVPGNPASAMVTFEVLVRPALRRMAGHARVRRRRLHGRAAERIRSPGDATSFLRARVELDAAGVPVARLTGPQGSGMLRSMMADALLVVPEGVREVQPGDGVELIPLGAWHARLAERPPAPDADPPGGGSGGRAGRRDGPGSA